MKPLRLMCWLCLSFFLFMATATAVSVRSSYRRLPQVRLSFAKQNEEGAFLVPLSSVSAGTDGTYCLFLVLEQEGAWGKEYVCKKVLLDYAETDPDQETAVVSGGMLSRFPVVWESERALQDGEQVRFCG